MDDDPDPQYSLMDHKFVEEKLIGFRKNNKSAPRNLNFDCEFWILVPKICFRKSKISFSNSIRILSRDLQIWIRRVRFTPNLFLRAKILIFLRLDFELGCLNSWLCRNYHIRQGLRLRHPDCCVSLSRYRLPSHHCNIRFRRPTRPDHGRLRKPTLHLVADGRSSGSQDVRRHCQ